MNTRIWTNYSLFLLGLVAVFAFASCGPSTAYGSLDQVISSADYTVDVVGWATAIDDRTVAVEIEIGDMAYNIGDATSYRPDVNSSHNAWGKYHGFSTQITGIPAGDYAVCAFGIDADNGSRNQLDNCYFVEVKGIVSPTTIVTPTTV